MKNVLVSWIGKHDLDAEVNEELGAVANILNDIELPFDEAYLLINCWFDQVQQYEQWLKNILRKRSRRTKIIIKSVNIESPIDYASIYTVCQKLLKSLAEPQTSITLNLTSGTPAMSAVWLLLGQGVFNTRFVQTSREKGLEKLSLPFDISLEYLSQQDGKLQSLVAGSPILNSHFEHIPATSPEMAAAVNMAKRLAQRDLPVIIQGASGTGKEVMANAIHNASFRAGKGFIAVNCGAIPESLIDSALFGHKKGAFTGADEARKGCFEEADGGTLFLDEIGELPLSAQVKFLRVLQQGEVVRVGESKPRQIDVRILAATHCDLLAMVEEGSFREDLFYRLAVGMISLPPLKNRTEDIPVLIDFFLKQINTEASTQPGYKSKIISLLAIKFIQEQEWPGNIRELWNTLLRASIWTDADELTSADIQNSLIQRRKRHQRQPHIIDVTEGVDMNEILDETKRYCIEQALKKTAGQKTKAAKLLGLTNHQTLTNWMGKLGIEDIE